MVAALGDFDVGGGARGSEEAWGGLVVEVGGEEVGCALPVVATEAALLFAEVALRSGGEFGFMRGGAGFEAGADLGC